MKKFLVVLILTLLPLSAFARPLELSDEDKNKIIGVRLSDISRYLKSNPIPKLSYVAKILSRKSSEYFGVKSSRVRNIFLTSLPEISDSRVTLSVAAFIDNKTYSNNNSWDEDNSWSNNWGDDNVNVVNSSSSNGYSTYYGYNSYGPDTYETNIGDSAGFKFVKISYNILDSKPIVTKNYSSSFTPLSQTKFKLQLSLVDRKLVMRDENSDLLMVFPVGVGAFDEKVVDKNNVALLTSRFKGGTISKSYTIEQKKLPSYYRGKPFISLVHPDGKPQGEAFHIKQNSKFRRGFDSHGCVRLREADLIALFTLISKGLWETLPLDVAYRIDDSADHPYPLINKKYKRVRNVGTYWSPLCIRTTEGWFWAKSPPLVLVEMMKGQPPVERLQDENDQVQAEKRKCWSKAGAKKQISRNNRRIKSRRKSIQRREKRLQRVYTKMNGDRNNEELKKNAKDIRAEIRKYNDDIVAMTTQNRFLETIKYVNTKDL